MHDFWKRLKNEILNIQTLRKNQDKIQKCGTAYVGGYADSNKNLSSI